MDGALSMRHALEPTDYPFFDYRRFTFSLAIATRKCVWLSGSTAVRHDKATNQMTVHGNLVDQADIIYQKMSKTLVAAALTTKNILHLVQYVTPSALPDLNKLAEFHRTQFEGMRLPSIRTIVVKRLLRDEALIEIEAIASANSVAPVHHLASVQASSLSKAERLAKQEIQSAGYQEKHVLRRLYLRSTGLPPQSSALQTVSSASSEVIVPCLSNGRAGVQIDMTCAQSGDALYVSVVGDASAGGIIEQTLDAYARLGKQLKEAGLGFEHIVKTTEFITETGLKDYRGTANVRRNIFHAPYPAATGVICEGLPNAESQILVEAIAMKELN